MGVPKKNKPKPILLRPDDKQKAWVEERATINPVNKNNYAATEVMALVDAEISRDPQNKLFKKAVSARG